MNVGELLSAVTAMRGTLRAENGRIIYKLPDASGTPAILQGLRENKAALLQVLDELSAGSESIAPLSYFQSGIWFQYLMGPGHNCYNVAACFRVEGLFSYEAFNRALEYVNGCYAILRTTYHDIPGQSLSLQCVRTNLPVSLGLLEAAPAKEPSVGEIVQGFIDMPFDLKNGPVWRSAVIRGDGGKTVVVVVVHHIACDAITLKMICGTLESVYREDGRFAEQAPCKENRRFVDYALRNLQLPRDARGRQLGDFWKNRLKGLPVSSSLPADFERPAIKKYNGRTITRTISGEEYLSVVRFCKANSLPVATLFLYCLFERLRDAVGQEDLCIGMLTSGRTNLEFRDVAGPLINTVPVRVALPCSAGVSGNIAVVKARMLEAMEMQDAPFGFILKETNAPRALDKAPLFQVLFNMVPEELLGGLTPFVYAIDTAKELSFAGIPADQVVFRQQEGQFDLTLEVVTYGETYTLVLKYDENLYAEETVCRLLDRFRERLHAIAHGRADEAGPEPKKAPEEKPVRELVVSADFTIDSIVPYLTFLAEKMAVPLTVRLLPAYQTQSSLRNPASDLYRIEKGAALLFVRPRDIVRSFDRGPFDAAAASRDLDEFREAIEACARLTKVPVVIVNCPDQDPENVPAGWAEELEERLTRTLADIKGCFVLPGRKLIKDYAVGPWYDAVADAAGSIPYSEPMFAALAAGALRIATGTFTRPFKAIVADCDGTLWEGVAAEDGPTGIRILPRHALLQQLLKKARSQGTLVCLCSKNEEQDVWSVFEKNRQMVLAREDIDFWRINWKEKADNIRDMAAEINIAPDSMVFLDDNPVECSRAAMLLPDLCTVQLPQNGEEWEPFFSHLWCLDARKATEEDLLRAESYRANHARESLRRLSGSFAEFMGQLELKISIEQARDDLVPRISQLTWRTNQFNNAGLRRSESEIVSLMQTEDCMVRAVSVEDRFGRYGCTGVIIGRREAVTFSVDTFLLSCRVLGRGVEYAMVADLAREALRMGCSKVAFAFTATEKNTPFRLFLDDVTRGNGFLSFQDAAYYFDATLLQKCSFDPHSRMETPSAAPKQDMVPAGERYCFIPSKSYVSIAELTSKADIIVQACRQIRGERLAAQPLPLMAVDDDIERALHGIWKMLLPPDCRFTVHDTFFDCGGTSIMIPRICSDLQRQTGIAVSIVDILQSPSIVLLAQQIRKRRQTDKPPAASNKQTDRGRAVSAGTAHYADRAKKVRASFLKRK